MLSNIIRHGEEEKEAEEKLAGRGGWGGGGVGRRAPGQAGQRGHGGVAGGLGKAAWGSEWEWPGLAVGSLGRPRTRGRPSWATYTPLPSLPPSSASLPPSSTILSPACLVLLPLALSLLYLFLAPFLFCPILHAPLLFLGELCCCCLATIALMIGTVSDKAHCPSTK